MTASEHCRRSEPGFTLVELMVVVLIIGILVAVATPVFTRAQGLARERTCQANLRTIDGAIQQWRADAVANDPAALEGAEPFAVLENAVGMKYLHGEPHCPSDGSAYTIEGGRAVCTRTSGPAHTY